MPKIKKASFKVPENTKIKIWRYMDFTKFVSLLEEQAIFFSRADFLGDPLEGSVPLKNVELRPTWYKDIPDSIGLLSEFRKRIVPWTCVSCWHMNEFESAAMWRLYARTNEAVCVQSTYEKFTSVLDEHINVGEVQYIDYGTDVIPESNVLYAFLHKRKSFEHERELRAIKQDIPTKDKSLDFSLSPPAGQFEKVDLDKLIEAVYVAPDSPNWFRDLVAKLLDRYGLEKEVIQSSLNDAPLY